MSKLENFKNESNSDSKLLGQVDYTLLTPRATEEEINKLCEKADKLGVKSVCVRPNMVKLAKEKLVDSNVLVCTVISFPHGTDTTEQKLSETKQAIVDGADECDMVLNYPELKRIILGNEHFINVEDINDEDIKEYTNSEYYKHIGDLTNDVEELALECHKNKNKNGDKVKLKVIVESGLLTDIETIEATNICLVGGSDFIKTSTGMVKVGAELDKVKIMKNIIDEDHKLALRFGLEKKDGKKHMEIKASGGIRTLEDMLTYDSLVDRFGMGFGSVDSIFLGEESDSSY